MKSFDLNYYSGYRIVFNDNVLNIHPPPTAAGKKDSEDASIKIVAYLLSEGFFDTVNDFAQIQVVRHEAMSTS